MRRQNLKPVNDEGSSPLWEYRRRYRNLNPDHLAEDYFYKDNLV
jgi:hypothetical protein